MGGKIYSMNLNYGGKKMLSPDLNSDKIKISLHNVNFLLGLDLKETQIPKLLGKMGYDFKNRLKTAEQIFQEEDPIKFTKELRNTGVNYLYFPKTLKPSVNLSKTSFKQILVNSSSEIWKVN